MSSTPGWGAPGMSAGPTISAGCATMAAGCATVFARARCRPRRGSLRSRSLRSVRRPRRSPRSCSREGPSWCGTEPLKALVIGAFVRGLSMRDIESLCEKAGLGKLSKSTASRICSELRERFEAFKRRDLYEIRLVALFLDAIYLAVRPQGPKEGVLCAWGFTEEGERVLVGVSLGMRESHEDWLCLARDLIARGLGAPMLVVADGAPGLIKAGEQGLAAPDPPHLPLPPGPHLI